MDSKYIPITCRGWFFSLIPANWKYIPLKYACDISSQYGANIPAEKYTEDGIRFLRTSDITENGNLLPGGVFIEKEAAASHFLKTGDIIISRSGTVGRSFLYKDIYGACAFAGYLIRYQLKKTYEPRYFFYLTKSAGFQEWLGTVSIEATIGNVNAEKYSNFSFPEPNTETQCLIANYLDRETARIDALVAEKERMLALLEEKRAALISRAVTRGLDPDVPMRRSGQAWLGEIPAHWQILRLKFLVDGIDQGSSPQCESSPAEADRWGVLKTGCVNGGIFRETENKALPDWVEPFIESEIQIGDILMSRASGSVELIGSVAIVQRQPAARLLLSDKIYRLKAKNEIIIPDFLVFAMGARYLRQQIKSVISGAEGLANNIAKTDILEFVVVVPPVSDQERICKYLKTALDRNDVLRIALKDSLSLAKERRAALITAAVTGQIPLEAMRTSTTPA